MIVKRLVSGFVLNGKRSKAETLFKSLIILRKNNKGSVEKEFRKVCPSISFRMKRKGGINYKIPYTVTPFISVGFGIRWLRSAVKERKELTFESKLISEWNDLSQNRGKSFRKKEEAHQLGLSNRGLIRFLRNSIHVM